MNETRTLASFVAETPYEALSDDVVELVRICILDNFASGLAGCRGSWAEIVAGMVEEYSTGTCSLFGRRATSSPSGAALYNGVAVGGFETDHAYNPGSCHPGSAVFPAVLAAAEITPLDGRGFLTATALGYEALCRVGAAATRAVEDERGFHGPGTNAPIGAAFGAGRALGFASDTLVNAVGIAGSHGGGLLEFHVDGAMTKRLHVGRGSQLGLESALLAQRGFTGPATVLEGEHGFLRVYSPSPKPELLLDGLGERWLLSDLSLKAFPCHRSFHSVVDAIHRLRATREFSVEAIESVTVVSTGQMMEERFGERAPTTLMGGQYSLPWSAALALCHDPASPASWTEAALADERVNALAAKVRLRRESPAQPGVMAEVELTLRGERHVLEATDWKGAASNPYSFDEMGEKFRRYAGDLLPTDHIEQTIERVGTLESEADVSTLVALIRAS